MASSRGAESASLLGQHPSVKVTPSHESTRLLAIKTHASFTGLRGEGHRQEGLRREVSPVPPVAAAGTSRTDTRGRHSFDSHHLATGVNRAQDSTSDRGHLHWAYGSEPSPEEDWGGWLVDESGPCWE